jgi:hypothetical protein
MITEIAGHFQSKKKSAKMSMWTFWLSLLAPGEIPKKTLAEGALVRRRERKTFTLTTF